MRQCSECGSDSIVVDSRGGNKIAGYASWRRRRECKECGARWTSYEVHEKALESISDRTATHFMDAVVESIAEAVSKTAAEYEIDPARLVSVNDRQRYTDRDRKELFSLIVSGASVAVAADRLNIRYGTANKWVDTAGGVKAIRNAAEAAE